MNTQRIIFTTLLSAFFFFSCNQQGGETTQTETEVTEEGMTEESMEEEMDEPEQGTEVMESNGIRLVPVTNSPRYPMASLRMNAPAGDVQENNVKFSFTVENYELGVQTEDAETKGIANSGKGQHIHLILNNGPYSAHYEPEFTKELEPGNYVSLAFLSRSYHESVKSPEAYHLSHFTVGDVEKDITIKLEEAPHMFYSRPKGTYSGKDTERVLLDFFLYNVGLSPDGYKVLATINDSEFTLTQWLPYLIEGAPTGDLKIKLELVDGQGNTVDSPFNPVERVVKLEAAEDKAS